MRLKNEKDSKGVQPGISLVTATAIVVANMVGTGIFTSLGFQVTDIRSGFALILLWSVGGICALCGALAYGELASALPRSGGEYHFLSELFHPSVGFVAGWTSATAGFAAPVALSAMAFGQYFKTVLPGTPPLALSLAIVWIITLIHLHSVHAGSVFQNLFTWLKVALILIFVAAGFALGHPQPLSFLPGPGDAGVVLSAPFGVSLVYVMYSFSGWNASTYIIGEVRDPERNVPRSLLRGTLIVTVLYLALNMMFLYTTPIAKMKGQLDIGVVVGTHVFGNAGGRLIGALICMVLISSISSLIWIGPRVSMTMGEDVRVLRFLSKKNRRGIPVAACLAQLAITSVLLFTATFNLVLIYVQFTLILCSFLTVAGMFILRLVRLDLPRPGKTWGYPFTPLVFLGISGFMMFYIVKSTPWESVAGLGTMLLGLLIYFISPRSESAGADPLEKGRD